MLFPIRCTIVLAATIILAVIPGCQSLDASRSSADLETALELTAQRLKDAADLLATTDSLPQLKFMQYYKTKRVLAGELRDRLGDEDLCDGWGNDLYVMTDAKGLHVVSPGADGRISTEHDNGYWLAKESEFYRICVEENGALSSPEIQRRIREAFRRSYGEVKGVDLQFTSETVMVVLE